MPGTGYQSWLLGASRLLLRASSRACKRFKTLRSSVKLQNKDARGFFAINSFKSLNYFFLVSLQTRNCIAHMQHRFPKLGDFFSLFPAVVHFVHCFSVCLQILSFFTTSSASYSVLLPFRSPPPPKNIPACILSGWISVYYCLFRSMFFLRLAERELSARSSGWGCFPPVEKDLLFFLVADVRLLKT